MRHRLSGNKLSRPTGHRKSMLRGMVTALIQNESLQTTEAKAREAGRLTEKMITLGKKGSLHHRRQAAAVVVGDDAVRKLFGDWPNVTRIGQADTRECTSWGLERATRLKWQS